MARLIKLGDTKWKQLFIDRSTEYHLWSIHKDVKQYCGVEDGQNRRIRITFDPNLNVGDIEQEFHITSGKEISFPRHIQLIFQEIVPDNRTSYYIAEIIDVDNSTPTADDIGEPDLPERAMCQTYRILRDTALARRAKTLHRNRCQLCETEIPLPDGTSYSEAHHIRPLGNGHNGPDTLSNILVVCPNHHAMLDYGSIRLIFDEIRTTPEHVINPSYIEYHNEVICAIGSR